MKPSMKHLSEASSFAILPAEMKLEIFGYLPEKIKKEARIVCKEWSDLISSSFEYSFRVSDMSIKVILNTKQDIDVIETGVLQQPLPISSTRGGTVLDTAQGLIINSNVSPDNIRKLLHNCPNIWKLELNYLAKNALQPSLLMRKTFPMQNLQELKMVFYKFEPYQATILKKLTEVSPSFPALGSLQVSWDYSKSRLQTGKLIEFYEAYLSVHRFIWKHANMLTSVEIDFSEVSCCGWNHQSIVVDSAMEKRYNELIGTPAKSNFLIFCIGFPVHEGEHPWNLSTILMKAQTHLWKLTLDLETVVVPQQVAVLIPSVYSQCSKSLRITTVLFPDSLDFDCAWLKECVGLISIFIESFRPLINIRDLPRNVYTLTLEGRPSLSSSNRRWIADNLKNASALRLNLICHPVWWNGDDADYVVLGDVEHFLVMPTVKSLSLTVFSFCDYSGILLRAMERGFSQIMYHNCNSDQLTFEFTKDEVVDNT